MSDVEDKINKDNDGYEKICYMCRRPESKCGQIISVPGGFDICTDCLQKTFDTMQTGGPFGDLSGLSGIPGMPNISFVNMDGMPTDIPQRQKLKKKTKEEKKETEE